MSESKCPKCGKQFIDEWEQFEHEFDCRVSCFTCIHGAVPSNAEPCKSCTNRCNGKEGQAK